MQVYQDLCKKHTTFRERSENTDLAVSSILLYLYKYVIALKALHWVTRQLSSALCLWVSSICDTTEAEGLQIPGARI